MDHHAPGVLVVDDDLEMREILADILSEHGYITYGARNGKEGVATLQRVPISVILLDVNMPVMDGYAFRSAQLMNLASAQIPLVVVSAEEGAERSKLARGACAYLKKPFSLPELIASVERCVSRG